MKMMNKKQSKTTLNHIGIIGLGMVGSAVNHGLRKIGFSTLVHDIKLNTSIKDVLKAEIVYVCVPTPSGADGTCDIRAVNAVVEQLVHDNYKGIIAIKSTIEPGTTVALQNKYPNARFAHVPEFLRERCALSDFVDNQDLCVVGTEVSEDYEIIKASHGSIPDKFVQLTPTEAEIAKYFNNVYNAMHIVFANNFYEICHKLGANYTHIKNAMVSRKHIYDQYLECGPNIRGFGGACLPKDTKAIESLCRKLNLNINLFRSILRDNALYETTIL